MVLLRTSYMYGGFPEYYFKLQFITLWSMHDKTSSRENANFNPCSAEYLRLFFAPQLNI